MTKKLLKLPEPIFDDIHHIREKASDNKDIHYTCEFLLAYAHTSSTFNAYRREVERLLFWTMNVINKTLPELTRKDIEQFLAFCQNPPAELIGHKTVSRYKIKNGYRQPNSEWRLFVINKNKKRVSDAIVVHNKYEILQTTIQSTFAILSSFFNFLIHEGYCAHNPVAMIRQKSRYLRKTQSKIVFRKLNDIQWNYVIRTAESMDERTLFIVTCLYSMYLRISELACSSRWMPQMQHFFQDGNNNWWFKTVGKGNKERNIAVSNDMLDALKRYRLSLGLTPLPSPGDTRLLLYRERGAGGLTGTRQIRKIVQDCFDNAVAKLVEDNLLDDATRLRSATVHWLRHTGISDDVKIRPRDHVREDAGHGSGAVTDRYIDTEMQDRADSARFKQLKQRF